MSFYQAGRDISSILFSTKTLHEVHISWCLTPKPQLRNSALDHGRGVGAKWEGLSTSETAHLLEFPHTTLSLGFTQNGAKIKPKSVQRLVDLPHLPSLVTREVTLYNHGVQKSISNPTQHNMVTHEADSLQEQKTILKITGVSQEQQCEATGGHNNSRDKNWEKDEVHFCCQYIQAFSAAQKPHSRRTMGLLTTQQTRGDKKTISLWKEVGL